MKTKPQDYAKKIISSWKRCQFDVKNKVHFFCNPKSKFKEFKKKSSPIVWIVQIIWILCRPEIFYLTAYHLAVSVRHRLFSSSFQTNSLNTVNMHIGQQVGNILSRSKVWTKKLNLTHQQFISNSPAFLLGLRPQSEKNRQIHCFPLKSLHLKKIKYEC